MCLVRLLKTYLINVKVKPIVISAKISNMPKSAYIESSVKLSSRVNLSSIDCKIINCVSVSSRLDSLDSLKSASV